MWGCCREMDSFSKIALFIDFGSTFTKTTAIDLDKEEVYRDFELTDEISLESKLSELATITDEKISPSIMRDYISEKKGLEKQDETVGKNKEEDSEQSED